MAGIVKVAKIGQVLALLFIPLNIIIMAIFSLWLHIYTEIPFNILSIIFALIVFNALSKLRQQYD